MPDASGQDDRCRACVELAIPFNGHGRMEVDVLYDDSRVVVEVDGALHLGDADAYRRDRRKDRLLQENGYTVLRFLADAVIEGDDWLVITVIVKYLGPERA